MNKLQKGDGVFAILMFVIGILVATSILKLQGKVRTAIENVIGKTTTIIFILLSFNAFSAETDAMKVTKQNFFESGYSKDLSDVKEKRQIEIFDKSSRKEAVSIKVRSQEVKRIKLIDLPKLKQSIVELVEKYDLQISSKGNIICGKSQELYGNTKQYLKKIPLIGYSKVEKIEFFSLKTIGPLHRLIKNGVVQPIDGGRQMPLWVDMFQGGIY